MCDTPFKTPKPASQKSEIESEESIVSSDGGSDDLSIVTSFDDIVRLWNQKQDENTILYKTFINSCEQMKLLWLQYNLAIKECNRLQAALEIETQNNTEYERRLLLARKMLDDEKRKRKIAEQEVLQMKHHVDLFCRNVTSDERTRNQLPEDLKNHILHLSKSKNTHDGIPNDNNYLDTIREGNTTGSILSDLSYSRSENDLDISKCFGNDKTWKKYRPSTDAAEEPAVKKRRSSGKVVEIGTSETIRATTTLTVNKEGPITATSVIESIPNDPDCLSAVPPKLVIESWGTNCQSPVVERINNHRQHQFQHKTVVMPDSCSVCEKRIRFGRSALRCKDCKSFCHPECKNQLPLPCVPLPNTPSNKRITGMIGDYTPTCPPMVPALIVHCTNEIEQRGLNEVGLYRIPGSEKEVKSLKERFLTGRGSPNIKDIDVHVLCGCVKDFLRSLAEPLITFGLWQDFAQAVQYNKKEDVDQGLYRAISELPQPNKDTLAYMILHLQRIAKAPDCKMPIDSLSKIFGPTIVSYSAPEINPNRLLEETKLIVTIMDYLLKIPSDYWSNILSCKQISSSGKLQQTPSTDSLLRTTTNGFFTPSSTRSVGKMKRHKGGKYLATTPYC